MGKNITMKDIAKELQVSTVTVSKALSDKEGVSEAVRQKIKQKADEMGYRYNSLARSMKEGVSYNVGVVVAERFFSDNAFYANLYQRLVIELGKENYSCILEILSYEDEKQDVMPKMISGNKVDGLIVLGQLKKHYVMALEKEDITYIFLDWYDEQFAIDTVVSDNVYGGCILTNYLIENGHRRIGFIGDIMATSSILDRYLGYCKALLQQEIPVREDWTIKDRDEDGRFIHLELPEDMPTAFVCNCDEIAYYLVKQLKDSGYRVPEDISVVSFDDFIYASLCNPQLTTFRISQEMMAETVVDALTRKMKDRTYHAGRKVISGNIVIRDSVCRIK